MLKAFFEQQPYGTDNLQTTTIKLQTKKFFIPTYLVLNLFADKSLMKHYVTRVTYS